MMNSCRPIYFLDPYCLHNIPSMDKLLDDNTRSLSIQSIQAWAAGAVFILFFFPKISEKTSPMDHYQQKLVHPSKPLPNSRYDL